MYGHFKWNKIGHFEKKMYLTCFTFWSQSEVNSKQKIEYKWKNGKNLTDILIL